MHGDKTQETHHVIRRTSYLLVGAILLSRVIGFFREWALARLIGASSQTDVYLASFTIPDLLNYLLAAGALSISFIPIFSKARQADPAYANAFFRVVSTWMSLFILSLIVIAMIFAPTLAHMVAPGFEDEQKALLVQLVRIILPAQFFFYWGGLANAVQQVNGIFLYTALGGIFYNLGIVLVGIVLHQNFGVMGFSIGVLIGAFFSHGVLQAIGLYRLKFSLVPRFKMGPEIRADFRRYLVLSLPIMLGFSLVVTDEWMVKFFASTLEMKNVSWLTYARTLMRVPIAVVGQVAGIASFPFLARLWSEQKFSEFGDLLSREFAKVWAFGLLSALFLFLYSIPVTHFVYRGGKFSMEDLAATAELLRWFSLGIPFWIAQVILSRGFYAAHITWLPTVVGSVLSLILFPLDSYLKNWLGAKGLAMGSAAGIAAYCFILLFLMKRRFQSLGVMVSPQWLKLFFLEWTVAAGILLALGYVIRQMGIYQSTLWSALAEVLVAISVMGGGALLLSKHYFRRRLGWDLI